MAAHGSMGKHYGSFGKGFADALVQMMRLGMTMQLYKARADYYKARGWAATHPKPTKQDEIASHTTPYTGKLGEGGGQPAHPATGAWWTPDRMSHAVDRLEKEAGLSHEGASGLVARWSGIEAGAGPSAYNPAGGGHYGIGQWGADRGGAEVGKGSFDDQLTHAIGELNGPEKSAADVLRRASTPEEGARGASMYERGEDYNASTGNDRFTANTPVQRVMDAVGGGAKPATTTATKTGAGTGKVTTGKGDQLSPAGGPYVEVKGKRYETDADGKIGKEALAAPPAGSYQVAGDTDIALTPEAAAKAQADLEAHRAAPTRADLPQLAPPGPDQTGQYGVNAVSQFAHLPTAPTPSAQRDTSGAITPQDTSRQSDPRAVPDESSERPASLMPPYPQSTDYPQSQPPPPRTPAIPIGAGLGNVQEGRPGTIPIGGGAGNVMQGRTMPARPTSTGAMPPPPPPPASTSSQGGGYPPPQVMTGRVPEMTTPVVGRSQDERTLPAAMFWNPPSSTPTGMPAPGQTITGRVPEMTTPVVGGDERTQPAAANVPAPAAQPVSATRPVTPASNQPSGGMFTMVDRPNADPTQRNRGSPQGTALDLSHLWGPNPPVAARAPQPSSAPPPAPSLRYDTGGGGWAGTPNMDDVELGANIMSAQRKGGPIQRFQRGGIPSRPTMKLQAGGNPGSAESSQPYAMSPSGQAAYNAWKNATPSVGAGTPANPVAPTAEMTAGGLYITTGTGAAAVPANAQQAVESLYSSQHPYDTSVNYGPTATPVTTPAPATPAPAPAPIVAPTSQNIVASPVVTTATTDPTTTTTTGAVNVPNAIQAKSYDPNVDATTGAGFTNTSSTGGTNYSVGSDDTLQSTSPGTISGTNTILSRRGGPIRRFANGGAIPSRPTMKFQTGGAAAYGPGGLLSPDYSGPTAGGGWAGTPYAQMAPNQQAWATNQQTLLGEEKANANNWGWSGWSQLSGTPAAIWPTPAPAAPAPVAQPAPTVSSITPSVTNTPPAAVTGVPGVSNSLAPAATVNTTNTSQTAPTPAPIINPTGSTITAPTSTPLYKTPHSLDPNDMAGGNTGGASTGEGDWANTGGTNYAIGSNTFQAQNSPVQIGGFRRGGAIPGVTPRVTQRRVKYDDGGGVSASALGMPPGLSGQQQIPPYYYNPATYAGAGAPVGKGVTQTSAPVYSAGAIPSLPMAGGGVVTGYDDGGEVAQPNDMADLQNLAFTDMQDEREDAQNAPPAEPPVPTSDKDPGWYINPQDVSTAPATQGATGGGGQYNDSNPPPDQTMPQGKDDAGNPSRGLIGAISSGLHWLADHLGIGGAQAAIASNPDTQDRRQKFVSHDPDGETYISPKGIEELNDINDPHHELQTSYRGILGLEQGYKWALARGDDATASRLAASILHSSVLASQNLSVQARHSLYAGNMQDAVDKMNQASDAVPDGRLVHATLNKDGTVTIQGKNLNGEVEWQQHGAAATILERATSLGSQGKLQWDSLESQAAKYDSTYKDAVANRRANLIAQGKADQDADAQRRANEQITKFGPEYDDGAAPPTAPTNAPPVLTPVSKPALPGLGPAPAPPETAATAPPTPPSPGRSPDTTTAQTAAPPPTSDSSLLAKGPTGHGGALPATAGADIPAADAQDVDLEHSVAYQQIPARANMNPDGSPKYFTADMHPIVGNHVLRPPTPIDEVTLKSYAPQVQAAYRERQQRYQAAVQENQRLMQADIDGQRRDLAADITSRRTAQTQAHSDTAAATLEANKEKAATKLSDRQADRAAKAEADKVTLAQTTPMDPTKQRSMFTKGTLDPETGMEGHETQDYLAATPFYAYDAKGNKIDGGAAKQNMGRDWDDSKTGGGGAQRVNLLENALYNTQGFNPHVRPEEVSEWLVGAAKGAYSFTRASDVIDDGWGPRYSVTFSRGDGSGDRTLAVPVGEYKNLSTLRGFMVAKNKAAPPAAASGPAIANAPIRAPSPTAGQGAPIAPRAGASPVQGAGNPVVDFFHRLNNPPPVVRGHGFVPTQPVQPTQ